jgi:hypothetical protein
MYIICTLHVFRKERKSVCTVHALHLKLNKSVWCVSKRYINAYITWCVCVVCVCVCARVRACLCVCAFPQHLNFYAKNQTCPSIFWLLSKRFSQCLRG